jgi:hypothetical protein
MSARTCSNGFFESPGGYGKSPCFLRQPVSASADVDGSGASLAVSNITFGME